MMRKILVLLLAVFLIAAMLTACGGVESNIEYEEKASCEPITEIETDNAEITSSETSTSIPETDKKSPDTGNLSDKSAPSSVPVEKEPVHLHTYSSSVTIQPSCGASGERTYTCSCGYSYTKRIDPTENHIWQPQYRIQTIPEQSHTKQVWGYICNDCGTLFETWEEANDHIALRPEPEWTCHSWTYKFKEETVIDVPEHTEQICIGTQCTVCGEWMKTPLWGW